MRRLVPAVLGSLIAASATTAQAQMQDSNYPYFGLSVGRANAQFDERAIAARQLGAGRTITAISGDDKDTAYRLFGGYQFHRNFALELGYFDLGKSSYNASTLPVGALAGELAVQGVSLDLVATVPLTSSWSLLGRVGAQHARTSSYLSGTGSVVVVAPDARTRDTNAKVGLGLQYAFSPSFLMRAEAERYRVRDGRSGGATGNINVASLSLVFPFGRAPAPSPRVAAPVYVPPAPMPAPPPVVVAQAPPPPVVMTPVPPPAPAPIRQRVSFSAETLFAFDRAEIRPEGRAALDKFARDLDGARVDTVVVEGHTDRLGATAYNQALSVKRAETVKSYLVDAVRLSASNISAVGKGESQPVTKPGECKGERQTPALIACLQPDRRVDVVITGMR